MVWSRPFNFDSFRRWNVARWATSASESSKSSGPSESSWKTREKHGKGMENQPFVAKIMTIPHNKGPFWIFFGEQKWWLRGSKRYPYFKRPNRGDGLAYHPLFNKLSGHFSSQGFSDDLPHHTARIFAQARVARWAWHKMGATLS